MFYHARARIDTYHTHMHIYTYTHNHLHYHYHTTHMQAADHSVLLFASPPDAGHNGHPIKTLVAFQRIHSLSPGGETTVTLHLDAWSLALADQNGVFNPVKGDWVLSADTGSDNGSHFQIKITVS